MDKRTKLNLPSGVLIRELVCGAQLQVDFCSEWNSMSRITTAFPYKKTSIQYADNLRNEIKRKISDGSFDQAEYFPESPRAQKQQADTELMEVLLDNQLARYKNKRQVENGQMSPATLRGYAKSLTGGRIRRLHGVKVADVIPSAVRDWISDMDCISKAICNMLSPIRSVIEDALNDGVIEFNPFDMDRTRKVNQTKHQNQ